ncbi:glycosyltransferase [Rhizosaccharibacter radicis]|uniref:Glycosyltransferase n=1 Tax=Rhizosaccharibacter radicis TaxID=2782605 RepID=A0ABT1VVF6_9PROT|nr:glycosyltransferase [Acetobacteraceae bacterium KSS12]
MPDPATPDPSRRRSGRITEADRAAWRDWAQERAQESFRQGQRASDAGQAAEALDWFERARRLAPDAPVVPFPLAMARLANGDPHGAMSVLVPLLRHHEFREGLITLAIAQRACNMAPLAASTAARALSRHAVDPQAAPLLGQIAAAAGLPGWCGVVGTGELLFDPRSAAARSGNADAPTFLLDGRAMRPVRRRGTLRLPDGWRGARALEVAVGGCPLMGSPFDLAAINHASGFVEETAEGLVGWIWHPNDPDRVPAVAVLPAGARPDTGISFLPMSETAIDVASEQPLARPRRLHIPAALLPDGPVRVVDESGRDLAGSPLHPGLQRRAAVAVAAQQRVLTLQAHGLLSATAPLPTMPFFLSAPAALRGDSPAIGPGGQAADVVVPVFRDRRLTLACLASVLDTVPAGTGLVVVDDATPEPELASALDALAAAGRIRLIRHDRNRGFPHSANAGIAACPDRDVVLLNADTIVPPGWIEGLRQAAYAAPDIGTATPFSNDASILSYPDHRARNPMPDAAATGRLMALAARAAKGIPPPEIPTGNGFCLYLRRDCLDQVGLLREDLFAQGYGEENDLALRARHLGWRHVAAPGVFVAHVGTVSFGAARADLMRRNLAILNGLYPGYDALILAHIEADPLAPARRRLDMLRWGEARNPAGAATPRGVLLLTHEQGGGVERVVRDRVRRLRADGFRTIVLRPTDEGCALFDLGAEPEAAYPNLRFRLPAEFDLLVELLSAEGVRHVEWHHLLGHHPLMRGLHRRLGVPFDTFVHDYAWFCPRIALVGPEGRYCGEPDAEGCERCVAIQGSNLSEEIGVRSLLRRSTDELRGARRLVVPSRDVASRMARHFAGLSSEIVPWEDDQPALSLGRFGAAASQAPRMVRRARSPGRARFCVIGAIGREKGYEVLLGCLRDAAARNLPIEFVVVGHTPDDDALLEAGCLFVTGEYREDEAVELVRAQQADMALLPSIWPETWCFTLGLAWRAGLPVAAFDIGAPAERIRDTRRGVLLPLGMPVPQLNDVLVRLGRANVSGALTQPA